MFLSLLVLDMGCIPISEKKNVLSHDGAYLK